MRIVFAGTPEFAAVALDALLATGHDVVGVLTQPDRPAGRGMKLQPSAVKQRALAAGLPVWQPASLRLDGKYPDDAVAARAHLNAAAPEVMVVAAYGLLLPPWVLALPKQGCLNIHASLLPRWRGAAPIHRAIEAGDALTGIAIMQMDAGLDTGAVGLSAAEPISLDDTTARLHDRLALLGGRLIVQALQRLAAGTWAPRAQAAEGVTYARKIDKSESEIDWRESAVALERRVRAFDPSPGVALEWWGERIKLWRARVLPLPPAAGVRLPPGTPLDLGRSRLAWACGEDAIEALEIQRPGGKRM
jgi:methionyl-tRNA formyltransferase